LTAFHIGDMVFHIKTTFNIDEQVMARLREESLRQGKTITELVESALRLLLRERKNRKGSAESAFLRGRGA
jgi:hypothetical protein